MRTRLGKYNGTLYHLIVWFLLVDLVLGTVFKSVQVCAVHQSHKPSLCLFSPIPHIVWRKVDSTDLPANHEISESGAVLHLYNVQYEDVGSYECEAINTKGKDWYKAWLYVEGKLG